MFAKCKTLITIIFFLFIHNVAHSNEYPGRPLFPNVSVMSMEDLHAKRDQVIIVDVRSAYEYQTLRIKGAWNVPLNSKTFGNQLQELLGNSDKSLVFYCNGKTCLKSYKAAHKAQFLKFKNCFAYDAGIFDWARNYPVDSVLLGSSPIDPGDLIDKKGLNAHMLAPEQFESKVLEGAIIVDVREPLQREGIGFFTGRESHVTLDQPERLNAFIDKAIKAKKDLLIYDEVGKQVRWLQYSLERKGLKNYYFMKGGAKAYYNLLAKRLDE